MIRFKRIRSNTDNNIDIQTNINVQMNNINNYNNSYINRRNLNRRNRKMEKSNLIELKAIDENHGIKCLFGDENPPFWVFECGGYLCNNCCYKIVSNVRNNIKCTKCEKELKIFKFCNRYSNTMANEENNTLIDLKDVNLSVLEDEEEKEKKETFPKNFIDDNECRERLKNIKQEKKCDIELKGSKKEEEVGKQTCQICFVLKSSKKINCDSMTNHMICSYCYNRMIKIDKIKLCPFCRTEIKNI